jgi:ankyrin repeat protein
MRQRMAEMRTCRTISANTAFTKYSSSPETVTQGELVSAYSINKSSILLPAGTEMDVHSPVLGTAAVPVARVKVPIGQSLSNRHIERPGTQTQDALDVSRKGSNASLRYPSGRPNTSTSFEVEGNGKHQAKVANKTESIRTGISVTSGILKRVSIDYTTSYIEDCASLLKRFSLSSSDCSSIRSIFRLNKPSVLGDEERGTSLNDQGNHQDLGIDHFSVASEAHCPELVSNELLLYSCCRTSWDCIHRFVASLANQCPENNSCQLFLSKSDAKRRDIFGNSPLHIAAKWGATLPVFESLVSANADIAAVNSAGQTFLHLLDATSLLKERNYFFTLFSLLLHYNFSFDVRDECGKTFLHSFLQNQEWRHLIDPDLIERLLEMTVTNTNVWTLVHARDNTGLNVPTLLHARNTYRIPLHGRQLIVANPEYHSILQPYYINATDFKCAELIPSEDCLMDQQYFLHYNPHIRRLHPNCIIGLSNTLHQLAYPPNWPRTIRYAFEVIHAYPADPSRYKLIDDIIDAGGDVNGYDDKGTTPLMAFVSGFGSKENVPDTDSDIKVLVQYLIRKGADVHRRDRRGETALHKAVRRGLKLTTELLLDRGSNIHARTYAGQGILADAYESLQRAKSNDVLYARILACLMIVIHRGGVANPTVEQERRYNNKAPSSIFDRVFHRTKTYPESDCVMEGLKDKESRGHEQDVRDVSGTGFCQNYALEDRIRDQVLVAAMNHNYGLF